MNIVLLLSGNAEREEFSINLENSLKELGHKVERLRASLVEEWELQKYDLIINYIVKLDMPDNIPSLYLDLGYLDRYSKPENPQGYIQVCPRELNNIVKEQVNSNRCKWEVQKHEIPEDGPVIILGQKEGDKQHRMSLSQLKRLYQTMTDDLKSEFPKREILFRNHPKSDHKIEPVGAVLADDMPLEHYTGICSMAVTYNSTAALDFLIKLIPVRSDSSAYFYEIGKNPTEESVTDLLQRLSYSQWSPKEFADPQNVNEIVHYCTTGELPCRWKLKEKPKPREVQEPAQEPGEINQFQIDAASAIMDESDFYTKKAMFKQVWPNVKCNSKKDIKEHCQLVLSQSKRS